MKNAIFKGVILVDNANPGIDPGSGKPRVNKATGMGIISQDTLKRKFLDRLEADGNYIIKHNNRKPSPDGHYAVKPRLKAKYDFENEPIEQVIPKICSENIDVGLFGILAPKKEKKGDETTKNDDEKELSDKQKGKKKNNQAESDEKYSSVGISGAVSVSEARSVNPINVIKCDMSKSFNLNDDIQGYRGPDTFGMSRYYVEHGVYVFTGGFTAARANENKLDEAAIEKLKEAMVWMFQDDYSTARPLGSMYLTNLFWLDYNENQIPNFTKKAFDAIEVKDEGGNPICEIKEDYGWVDLCEG